MDTCNFDTRIAIVVSMVSESTSSARAGRPKALSHRQILDAAAEIADTDGLDAVSFRVLAERLGISPMSVHRTTGGIDALRRDLISTLVGEAVSSIDWPTDWRGVARTFAYGLHDLLMRPSPGLGSPSAGITGSTRGRRYRPPSRERPFLGRPRGRAGHVRIRRAA